MANDDHDETCHFQIIVERALFIECEDIQNSLLDLIACYFVFNISYPNCFYNVFQHFILGIRDTQNIPRSVTTLYSSICKL